MQERRLDRTGKFSLGSVAWWLERYPRRMAWSFLVACFIVPVGVAQTVKPPLTPALTLDVTNAEFPVEVLVKGPADTDTELQIICLFRSDPSNTLHGSLIEMNRKLDGLLDSIRKPTRFTGELGETLLIKPGSGTLSARRLLIIGLGDSQTFTPIRMNLVGAIVFGEASRLRVKNPFFAPTVLDGGVSGFSTGEVAEQFMTGFLRAREVQRELNAKGESAGESPEKLTFLAGEQHAADTRAGIAKAIVLRKPR
jgi:hypothetical protein